MGTRTSYEPGTFSWVELFTPDPDDAKRFYGELFGWQTDASEVATLDGMAVAGIKEQPERQREAGVPPQWFNYVTVASADETTARVDELGGQVHAGPTDVDGIARVAIVGDPTGAMLGLWEPLGSIGAERVNEVGCLTSNELGTDDAAAASAFYEGLFGWSISQVGGDEGPPYWLIAHDGAMEGRNGGIRQHGPGEEDLSPSWGPYFTTASIEDTLERAGELGGGTVTGATEIPAGRFAVLRDPQGGGFSIFEGPVDD